MSTRLPRISLAALALAAFGCAAPGEATGGGAPLVALATKVATPASFALLELFTSEGCSDTPPSEKLTNELVEAARASDRRIFAIAYHVDYWDHLGWKDPFAKPGHADRQRRMAQALGDPRIATPQTFVSGAAQIAGTDRGRLDRLIADALARPATATVDLGLDAQPADGAAFQVRWAVQGAPAGAKLRLVLVERGIARQIEGGENAGKTLAHAPVARAEAEVDAGAGAGTAALTPPAGMAWERAGVVAYVQAPGTPAVLGAASTDLRVANP